MEEDHKNKASGKMISSTTDHHQKEGEDVAINDSEFSLQLASALSMTPKKRKEGPQTETTSAGTSSKKRRGCSLSSGSKKKTEEGPSETTTSAETSSGGERFITRVMNLNAGQDLVDAIYNLSEEFPRRSVIIHSAIGSVSEIGLLDPNGSPNTRQGKFQILTLAVECLVDDDGRHCLAKARYRVTFSDDKGITFGSSDVNSLKAAEPVVIVASSAVIDVPEESTASILAAATARNSDSDSEKVLEDLEAPIMLEGQSGRLSPTTGLLPPNPPATGGNINPKTTTNSTANDQDMKSPSVEDT